MRRAVVLGGSIAGLLAARVLGDHADDVVLLERDEAAMSPDATHHYEPRQGVPQGTQMHALLDGGRREIDHLFPGFSAGLVADGAACADTGEGVHGFLDGRARRWSRGMEVISADAALPGGAPAPPGVGARQPAPGQRQRARAHVHRRPGERGALLRVRRGRGPGRRPLVRRGGARRRPGGRRDRPGHPGRGLAEREWLAGARTEAHERGSRLRHRAVPPPPACGRRDRRAVPDSPSRRAHGLGTLGKVEGEDRWIALVAGYADDRPGRSVEEFLLRCKEDPATPFRELAEDGEPIGEPFIYRHPDNRRRDFHRLDRFPAGLVAVGDALASFNPVDGQGMSSAAMHASCLAAYLAAGPSPREPAWPYFRRARAVVDDAWQTSALNDLKMPHVTEPTPPGFRRRFPHQRRHRCGRR